MKTKISKVVFSLLFIVSVLFISVSQVMAFFGTATHYGERVTDGRFPAVVRVWFEGGGEDCSGVLITPRHVLTAAHCAPRHEGEIWDSAVYEENGRDPNDAAVDVPSFSFVSYPEQDGHPTYYPTQYWVHPWYDPGMEELALSDLMVLVLEDPVDGVEPAPVLGPIYREHLERGAWVRHVGFGPTEGNAPDPVAGAHQYKTTLLTRITDLFLDEWGEDTILTWGDAAGGDSGSPVFQRRLGDDGEMKEVVIGILMAGGIKSQVITQGYRDWIKEIVRRSDPSLLPDDYDFDAIPNYVDRCLIRFDSDMSWSDTDLDGVGDACDICPASYSAGQFDSDDDGICNESDSCPFGDSILSFEGVTIEGVAGYWTHNPLSFKVQGVQSNGRWFDEEYITYITAGAMTWDFLGLRPVVTLPEGEHIAQVHIEDGCGTISATHELAIGVDDTPPVVQIIQPADDWLVPQGSSLTVGVAVEDTMSGPASVELWLDYPGSEFDPASKLCDFPGPWPPGTTTTDNCAMTADFLPGEHRLSAVVKDAAGNEKVEEVSISCYEMTDSDHDGINDNIDQDPGYSECFEFGAISGCITDRGDQELTLTEQGGRIVVQADCSGGELPATISVPCNPGFEVEEINACESVELYCGSAIVRVRTGSVVVRLKGIVVRLEGGAEMTAREDAGGILHIENSSDEGLVIIEYGGRTQILDPSQSFDLILVNLDVNPGSCPNPLQLRKQGVIPCAILGSENFDVTAINPATLRLAGVAPIRWAVADVAAHEVIMSNQKGCVQNCSAEGKDGHDDLTLKLDAQEVIRALGDVVNRDCRVVNITGNLKEEFGGTAFYGQDVVLIRK